MNALWIPAGESEDALKLRYAALLHERPDTDLARMEAAKVLLPRQDQTFLALDVAQKWPRDPVVIAELDRLKSSGADHGLPTKADLARRYINIADNNTLSIDARLKAMDKYSELMGMKPVPGALGTGINIDNRRVFVLPAPQDMTAWEKTTVEQQSKLIEASVSHRE